MESICDSISRYSVNDLAQSRKTYDHIESKVKKIIDGMNADDRKKKAVISRHKSMPLSTQLSPIDDAFSHEKDPIVLIKELRKKSVRIYELDEKCEEKDSRIYKLEYERSKMKMTFDKLRNEMHDLKEIEKDYRLMMAISPPKTSLTSKAVQTDEASPHTKVLVYSYNDDTSLLQNRVIRELTFGSEADAGSQSLNQTHFSELNNASSDNLVPFSEISLENVNNARAAEDENDTDFKKPKKFRKFLKALSCVSK